MKLMIVDDAMIMRRAIERVFSQEHFDQIETASDGLLAVTLFRTYLPDVVTLDITMPHLDGLSVLEEILNMKPDTRVLVISALADVHTAIQALTLGAEEFICKPFTDSELKEALAEITGPQTGEQSQ